MNYDRKLILENGQEYYGYSFGSRNERLCEIVFNTSMVGYQEIISDPSYTYQAVVMTYPLIGNYGINSDDFESDRISIGALIVREINNKPSNFRSEKNISELLSDKGIPGIYGIDTRKLTRTIRNEGSQKVLITDASTTLKKGLKIINGNSISTDAVKKNSIQAIKCLNADNEDFKVAIIDCGMKMNIARSLIKRNCSVIVVPWNTSPDVITSMHPDGVLISNGPGDPTDVPETIETIRQLIGKTPLFGICLGHQLLSLAYGAKTYKLKFGHRGGNHPVKNLLTGHIEITSQNHSYAVDKESIANTPLQITHINLLDETIEGVRCEQDNAFSVQYHPESSPGPQDSGYLFDEFIEVMRNRKNA